MKKQLNEQFKRMQLLAGLITESQLGEAAGEDLELKSLAKKLFPIIKKYKMGVEYVTDTNEFNTKPQKTDPSFQVPAKILIKDGILTLAVYFLSLAKSINELDMGSGPSSEQYDNAKKQAALMYKDIAGVIGNEFEFRSQPTDNEYGFYLIQIRKKITAKGGATNSNQRPNAPKPAAPVPTSESTDIEKSVNEAMPVGQSKLAQELAPKLNIYINKIQNPQLGKEAMVHASKIIELIDKDSEMGESIEKSVNEALRKYRRNKT